MCFGLQDGRVKTLGAFGATGASHDNQRTPNVHISGPRALPNTTKIPREDPPERDKKNENGVGREKKNAKVLAPHPSGPPPFGVSLFVGLASPPIRGPTFQGPTMTGQNQFWPKPRWPKSDWPKLVRSGWPKQDWPSACPRRGLGVKGAPKGLGSRRVGPNCRALPEVGVSTLSPGNLISGKRLLKRKDNAPETPNYIAEFLHVTVRCSRPGWRI